jgi:hypothetical protein
MDLVGSPRFTAGKLNNWKFLELLPTLNKLSIPTSLESKFLRQLSRFRDLRYLTREDSLFSRCHRRGRS